MVGRERGEREEKKDECGVRIGGRRREKLDGSAEAADVEKRQQLIVIAMKARIVDALCI